MTDPQTLEMQIYQCVKANSHKTAGHIFRELRARFYDVSPAVISEILGRIIEVEVER